jgi:hypothetical protein
VLRAEVARLFLAELKRPAETPAQERAPAHRPGLFHVRLGRVAGGPCLTVP